MLWGAVVFFSGGQQIAQTNGQLEMVFGLLGQFAEVKSEADQLPFGLNFF